MSITLRRTSLDRLWFMLIGMHRRSTHVLKAETGESCKSTTRTCGGKREQGSQVKVKKARALWKMKAIDRREDFYDGKK